MVYAEEVHNKCEPSSDFSWEAVELTLESYLSERRINEILLNI